MFEFPHDLPWIRNTNVLEDLTEVPRYLVPGHRGGLTIVDKSLSCAFCGVGDRYVSRSVTKTIVALETNTDGGLETNTAGGKGTVRIEDYLGRTLEFEATLTDNTLEINTGGVTIPTAGSQLIAELAIGDQVRQVVAREISPAEAARGATTTHTFELVSTPTTGATQEKGRFGRRHPTPGCSKMGGSTGLQGTTFPIQLAPSLLDRETGKRNGVTYEQAIERLADLLLAHQPPQGRTLIYACGQIDYFTVFSFQEVFRLLGVRNLAGNAEHCLNAGAVHNEILTGQEGPFLTIDQGIGKGENRFYLFNGWNGLISHPPVFAQIMARKDFDGYLIETVYTESALRMMDVLRKQGISPEEIPGHILLIRSGTDPHLALGVAHEIFNNHADAIEDRFIDQYSDRESFENYRSLALEDRFQPDAVAERIAPEPQLVDVIRNGIRNIASKLADRDKVPINIPSVGLSQTKGAVTHCLWGNVFAMLGKYGLKPDGSPAGGTLRIPGQINAQSEIQGLSNKFFMGRIPMSEAGQQEAAVRMGLPVTAYDTAFNDSARCALDYCHETDEPELIVCFGTQFESNMPGRKKFIDKILSPKTTLVVVDPIADPFTLEHADLVIPSPPHSAVPKLYQNGEWRLTLSVPMKQRPDESRSDATIVYDASAEVSRRLREEPEVRDAHANLVQHADYMQQRFESPEAGGGLSRIDGEVSRPELWKRVQQYMTGPEGKRLYCCPVHADGRLIEWEELLEQGAIIYGGVGENRYLLDYDNSEHIPFRDVFGNPRKFTFFEPDKQERHKDRPEVDLAIAEGTVLITGRSPLNDDLKRYAQATFNSGKATPPVGMPDNNPLWVSIPVGQRLGLKEDEEAQVRVTGRDGDREHSLVMNAIVSRRVKGDACYSSFHKSRAEIESGVYLNDLTSHEGRCRYTHQSSLKITLVEIERLAIDQ